jgi:cytochrome bd-type quinol oxidase subunit 2
MTKRSVVAVILLTIVTLGIYGIVWLVKTKGEMVKCGADIPTAWLLLVGVIFFPITIWWQWKFAGGVEHVTRGKMSQVIAFILIFLLGLIGIAIIQAELNKAEGTPGALPQARVA